MKKYDSIIIYGPTASGKSGFGVELAKQINGEIINCDSTQIYKELPIITAQPTKNEMQNVPHHLYGILGQDVKINAVLWTKYLAKTLQNLNTKSIPIILGGTGLYVSVLVNNGFNYIPEISKDTREKVQNILKENGIDYIVKELQNADHDFFNKVSINDTQRILRAFEVLIETEKPISFWWNKPKENIHSINKNFLKIYLCPERDIIYNKCKDRFYEMIKMGALQEVENFINKYKDINKTQMSKIIGLTELQNVINGNLDIEAAIGQAVQRTRHYAKRQLTWFNNQLKHDLVITDLKKINEEIGKIKDILC